MRLRGWLSRHSLGLEAGEFCCFGVGDDISISCNECQTFDARGGDEDSVGRVFMHWTEQALTFRGPVLLHPAGSP